MTQNTQTTAERIAEMILRSIEQSIFDFDNAYDADPIAEKIAAEIDALTRERDEARAEVERLQTAAEAFWAYEVFTATYLREDRDKFAAAAARARAAKESQP